MDSAVPGTNNLTQLVDRRLVVVLRDGRKLYGILRSFDQFGNLVMQDTCERYYVDLEYAEVPRGVFVIRGENVVLIGELDEQEFQSVSRRMAKFKRSLESIMPRLQSSLRQIIEQREAGDANGRPSELMEHDFY